MLFISSFIILLFAHYQYQNLSAGSLLVFALIVLIYICNYRTFLGAVRLARLRPDKFPVYKWSSKYPDLAKEEISHVEKALEKWIDEFEGSLAHHTGSSAISGTECRELIDITVIAKPDILPNLNSTIYRNLSAIGYEYIGADRRSHN